MGLDMYLTAENNVEINTKIKVPGRIQGVICDVATWRKANQIHDWFVQNCQGGRDDCQKTMVSLDNLRELVQLCKTVLENKEQAPHLLPTSSGFFFGSTNYDDWYFQDLQNTVDMLEPIIKDPDFQDWWFFYQASW